MKIKNSVLVVLIAVLLILNIVFFVRYQIKKRQIAYQPNVKLTGLKVGEIAPAFVLKDLQGKEHSADELKGKTALLIFCNIEDEKSLLEAYYYKLLLGKYQDKGLLVWIVSNAKNNLVAKDLDRAYAPILVLKDEDGKITKEYCDKKVGKFQAFIIGADGAVKFRDYDLPNVAAKMMIEKFLLTGEKTVSKNEFVINENLPFFEYYDVKKDSVRKLGDFIGKPVFLTLFSANCPICKEHRRLILMQEAYQKYGPKGLEVILVYGKDNPLDIIRDYAIKNKLSFDVGVRKIELDNIGDYYQSYDLEVDPKSIIINSEGKVAFVEGAKDSEENMKKALEGLFVKH